MLAINIPADALFLAIQHKAKGDFSEKNCERIIVDYIDRFLEADPDMILLNTCYRRSLTPSEVFDSYLYDIRTDERGFAVRDAHGKSLKTQSPITERASKYFLSFITCARPLLKSGIDIYKMAIKRIRQTKCRVLLSIRMNDIHYTNDPAINSSLALKNGAENTLERGGKFLDFSKEAVQNYYYTYIEELLNAYQVDGIELDWLRYPRVLPSAKCADLTIISDYMKRVRRLVHSHNPNACLAVRMLPTEEENLKEGFDACGWIADGTVDMLTIENFYIPTNFELPVSQWRQSIEKRNAEHRPYFLFCGSDWAVSCVERYNIAMTPALVRGFTDACLEDGADGIYLFNFFEEDDTSSFAFVRDESGEGRLENCFAQRIKAARHPQQLPRRYVHIGNTSSRYPISVCQDGSYAFIKTLKRPFDKCRLVIGYDKNEPFSVYVNGGLAVALQKEDACRGFAYIPEAEIDRDNHFIYAVTQAAPFVSSVCLTSESVEKESLHIRIQNDSRYELKILWLEVVLE